MEQRFTVLDIFRGFFASMVFLFHLRPFAETVIVDNAFVDSAHMFVDFFFVLSGFVIAHKYEELSSWTDLARFYKKRFLRVYPLHLFILICFLLIELGKLPLSSYIHVNSMNNPNNSALTFFASLFLLNSFPIPGVRDLSWNIASWSISAEMTSYLVFGLAVIGINSMNIKGKRWLVYLAIFFALVAILIAITGTFRLDYTFNYGFMRALIGFFNGVLCYVLYKKVHASLKALNDSYFTIAELLIFSVITVAICSNEEFKYIGLLYEPLFFACIFVIAFEKGFISSQVKKVKLFHLAGKYSYSIYMTHTLLISLFNIAFVRILKFPPEAYWYLFAVNYILVFIVSSWTYKHIEARFYFRTNRV